MRATIAACMAHALVRPPRCPIALLDVQLHHHVVVDAVDGLLLARRLQTVAQPTRFQHPTLPKPPAADLQPKRLVASLNRPVYGVV